MALTMIHSPEAIDSQSRVALTAFRRLAERWGLRMDEQEILLATPRRTLYNWFRNPQGAHPDRDKVERISYLLGILSGLTAFYGDNAEADAWLRRPNDNFGGQSPLKRMLGGGMRDLAEVRTYIDRFVHTGW